MGQLLEGNFKLETLQDLIKEKTWKTKKGVEMVSFQMWLNDQPDQYGNTASFQFGQKTNDGKWQNIYFGNAKPKDEAPF